MDLSKNVLENKRNLFRVFITINKLLYNRGYNKSPLHNISFEEFCKYERTDLTIRTTSRFNNKGPIFVFFPEEEKGVKVGVKPIRIYKNEMTEANVKNAIIIVKNGITSIAKNAILSDLKENDPFIIEVFTESELLVDITEHILVPKHELLNETEKNELLKFYNIKESSLSKMFTTDPIARYYGFKKKDIVKITRLSETAGEYFHYRLVV